MRAIVVTSPDQATTLTSATDAAAGYPRPGVDTGGGVALAVSATPGPGWTLSAVSQLPASAPGDTRVLVMVADADATSLATAAGVDPGSLLSAVPTGFGNDAPQATGYIAPGS